jgi:hypothetical protein
MIGDCDMTGERSVVGMCGRHRGTLLGGELVNLGCGNLVIKLIDDFHSERGIVDFDVGFLTDTLDALQNLVE